MTERAPEGYVGTPEAAARLGVHQQTVRNYVKDGRLEGMVVHDPDTGRDRYFVERGSLESMVRERSPAEAAYDPRQHFAADFMTQRTEEVLEKINGWVDGLGCKLDDLKEGQQGAIEELSKMREALEEMNERSRNFQDKMLEALEEEREMLRKQREELGHEERRGRGFWRRLFGLR
jgi:hypothetical protein